MQYAVIKSGGKQYKVTIGDTLTLDKINFVDKKVHVFDEVLLLVTDGKITLGKPSIKGATVSAKLLEQKKGEKIRVSKYKAKVRYRKVMGFRPQLSVFKNEKIDS
ncbi:MAG: 50S ribosomal protein L21, partial [Candidatus Levybacteria bacterium]|nr:50S ribosomal protein L21 [Candidatus Levybacteria bacterium]